MRNPETNPISLFFKSLNTNHVGLIAVIFVLTTCYLISQEKEIPSVLEKMDYIIISFLFGNKVGEK